MQKLNIILCIFTSKTIFIHKYVFAFKNRLLKDVTFSVENLTTAIIRFVLLIVPRRYFCGGSFCFMSWCLNFLCAVGALCMFSYF